MTYDCRTINDGSKCEFLRPRKSTRLAHMPKFYICRASHNILWPEVSNQGKITERVISISPLYSCKCMSDLRAKGLAQDAEFTVYPDGSSSHWNKPIN